MRWAIVSSAVLNSKKFSLAWLGNNNETWQEVLARARRDDPVWSDRRTKLHICPAAKLRGSVIKPQPAKFGDVPRIKIRYLPRKGGPVVIKNGA